MPKLQFFALGGQDENGKNCFVIEYSDDIFIFNIGAKVPINSTYGVDTVIPSFSYLKKNAKKIRGIFITDTKNSSFSALPWILMQIPGLKIYTSPFSKVNVLDRVSKYKIGHNDYEIITISKDISFGDITIKPIQVFGSVPGTLGFDVQSPMGSVVFLLNFILGENGFFGKTDLLAIKKQVNNNLLALVMDSGKSKNPGFAKDKIHLPKSVEQVFENAKDNERIIVGAYDEEIGSLNYILDLAKKYNRPIITYGKSYGKQIFLIKKINPKFKTSEFLNYKKANFVPNALILVTGTVERLYQRFLRIAKNEDVYLNLKSSDNVIFIAPPVNGIEVIAAHTLDQVTKVSPKILDVTEEEYYRHRPASKDIYQTIDVLRPKYYIPVQGLYRYLVDAAALVRPLGYNTKNTLVLQNGKIAEFDGGKLISHNKKIKQVGDDIIDGFGLGDVSHEVIREREKMASNGVVLISACINKFKQIKGKIEIKYLGLVSIADRDEINDFVRSIVVNNFYDEENSSLKVIQEKIRKQVRKKLYKKIEKDPIVVVVFYKI